MKNTRFRLTVERIVDGVVERKMVEERTAEDDCADGEETVGLLLSYVPEWSSAPTGCSGLATICNMLAWLRVDNNASMELLKQIGKAYQDWTGDNNFEECVKVKVNRAKLDPNGEHAK